MRVRQEYVRRINALMFARSTVVSDKPIVYEDCRELTECNVGNIRKLKLATGEVKIFNLNVVWFVGEPRDSRRVN
jgi:hypothetical protein